MYTRYTTVETNIGPLTVVAADDSIVGIYYPQHWTRPASSVFGVGVEPKTDSLLTAAAGQLLEYLDGARTTFELPLATTGNPFQERVWAVLNEIPYGETMTYGEIAEKLGDRSLARIVGHAVGHNPLSIVVPCHRVVGKNGSLTGYAGGLERKQQLLGLEGAKIINPAVLF
jgi:methylated-DNA-[protein]-cysteine S-methyltransferase